MSQKRPTRTDLLGVISSLQHHMGLAMAANNDRNPNRFAETQGYLEQGSKLCIEARMYDPPGAGERSTWNRAPTKPRA